MAVNAYAQYQENQVATASPGRLVVMAYDGIIKFARIAGEKMRAGDLYGQNEYIKKSQAIILELAATIDPKPNPELASNLINIYEYLLGRLTHANIQNDHAALEEVLRLTTELRGAWAEIALGQPAVPAGVGA